MTALVRNEASITKRDGLTIVQGQPQDAADMEMAFNAVEGDKPVTIIVTLNSARTSDNPWASCISPPTYMHDSHVHAIEAMKKYGTRKIVTLQALGVGDSWPNLFWLLKLVFYFSNMYVGLQDHEAVEEVVKESGLNYVLARPIRLADGPPTPLQFFGDQGVGIGAFNTVTRASVARFLVDASEKDDWNGETPVISN